MEPIDERELKGDKERKQMVALGQERKRLVMLEELKEENGPFTNAEEVEKFMASKISENEKQVRLKKEVKYARDSSTTLPRVDSRFKIQVPTKNPCKYKYQQSCIVFYK